MKPTLHKVTRKGRTVRVTVPERDEATKTSRIDQFWLVTRPSQVSGMSDICFACDWPRLALQFAGGLRPEDILAAFTDAADATDFAADVLKTRDDLGDKARALLRAR